MATIRQRRAAKKVVENGGNVGKAMRDAGYSPATAKTPQKLTESEGWQQLMAEYLSDESLGKAHQALLNSHALDHMVFPPESTVSDDGEEVDESEDTEELEPQPQGGALKRRHAGRETTPLTDEDIKEMLASVNCTVRKIVHGAQARHVYFWAPDNRARKDALDMAYKLKGRYSATKVAIVDPYGDLEDDELEAEIARRRSDSGASQKSEDSPAG